MEAFIQCDNCTQEFNHYDRQAKLYPKCGHTLCMKCSVEQRDITGNQVCQCSHCGM